MAIAAVRYHHDERKVACSRERRAPQAGVSSSVASLNATPAVDDTKTTSSPGNLSATKLPIEVKALAGVITVLGLFIYFR
jgi:guanyl-specific ribonuclease Sa